MVLKKIKSSPSLKAESAEKHSFDAVKSKGSMKNLRVRCKWEKSPEGRVIYLIRALKPTAKG